jgi:four helix bundle protein
MGDFRRLRAWKEAQRLAILSRDLIGVLPRVETFSLGAQWRRAADGVVLNIAEGASQSSPRQFRRYLEIAKGSLDELDAVFELVEGFHYLSPGKLREVRLARTHCIRLVAALARSISRDLSRHAGRRLTRQRLTR